MASAEPDANTGTNSAAATNQPPAPTTPVPPPATGDVNQEAPVTAQSTDNPVPLSATADSGNGVSIAVTGVESMTTQAQLPGEISGPGVRVSVNIVNGSTAALDLGNVVVDLQDSTGVPANPMSASPAAPFSGSLAAGGTATAVYVFTLPSTYSDPATIYLTYTTEAAVVVFVGNIK